MLCCPKLLTVNSVVYSITRGNDLRLQKTRVTYDLQKYYFTNRALSTWNSLPNVANRAVAYQQLPYTVTLVQKVSGFGYRENENDAYHMHCFLVKNLLSPRCGVFSFRHGFINAQRPRYKLYNVHEVSVIYQHG